MLNCYIVDDESASIEIISDYINETKDLQLMGSSTKPHDALQVMLEPVNSCVACTTRSPGGPTA